VRIHACRRVLKDATALCEMKQFRTSSAKAGYTNFAGLPFGAVVGTAVLESCLAADRLTLTGTERSFGDFRPGHWASKPTEAHFLGLRATSGAAFAHRF
jgi:hypothetical protein